LRGTLAAGLATSFFAGTAFFAGAFLAAVLALDVAVVPVTTFFAGARLLAVVVFFAATGLALGLPAMTFLGAAFLTVVALGFAGTCVDFLTVAAALPAEAALVGLDDLVVDALVVVDLAAVGFEVVDLAVVDFGLAVAAFLEAGLFSFAAEDSAGLDLGASLTLPERPLGRTNTPFSVPEVMALDS